MTNLEALRAFQNFLIYINPCKCYLFVGLSSPRAHYMGEMCFSISTSSINLCSCSGVCGISWAANWPQPVLPSDIFWLLGKAPSQWIDGELILPLLFCALLQAEIAQLQEQLALKDAEIERLQSQLSRTSSYSEVAERGKSRGNKINKSKPYLSFALDSRGIQTNTRMNLTFILGGKVVSINSVFW